MVFTCAIVARTPGHWEFAQFPMRGSCGPGTHEAKSQVGSRPTRPTKLGTVRIFNGQGFLFLSHGYMAVPVLPVPSSWRIRTIPHTAYSTWTCTNHGMVSVNRLFLWYVTIYIHAEKDSELIVHIVMQRRVLGSISFLRYLVYLGRTTDMHVTLWHGTTCNNVQVCRHPPSSRAVVVSPVNILCSFEWLTLCNVIIVCTARNSYVCEFK